MKALYAALLAVAATNAAPASASPLPLIGSWAVDTSRLTMPPEARPKSVTISYDDVGGGKWRTNHFNRVR